MKAWETQRGTRIIRVLAGRSNVFLVANGGKYLLVDTSPGSRWKTLDRRLRQLSVKRLDALIVTHAHYDHAGCAARLQDKYEARVIAHIAEGPFLARGENNIVRGTNALTRLAVAVLGRHFARRARYEPCRPDIQVDPSFDLGEFGFKAHALHTPGHTAGSLSVIVDDEIALVGDAMFGIFPGSVFPPYAEDAGTLVRSWGKLLATKCRLFLPAHGSANSRQLVQKDYEKRKMKCGES
ncbi:MAG: MBL fold metallo-hydrolase [Acidobacteria bacterium]|jgi:glyoxylase-like metal-dependent hydrolase (beta-lactamase superfamily II)|nr:MBL fold metallo-hydrolase [Acidobacteriota bacterium]